VVDVSTFVVVDDIGRFGFVNCFYDSEDDGELSLIL
jgi:hypothetical protein